MGAISGDGSLTTEAVPVEGGGRPTSQTTIEGGFTQQTKAPKGGGPLTRTSQNTGIVRFL